MAARRFRRLGHGLYGGHAARLPQRIGKIRLRSRRRLALRILLHRHQIADGLAAALLLVLLLANLSGGGFRADGLPDQLQIRAPRPQRQQRVHRHRRRQQQRHGGQPLHAKVNRRAEQRQRAGCADDEIRVSRLFRVFPERDSRLVG